MINCNYRPICHCFRDIDLKLRKTDRILFSVGGPDAPNDPKLISGDKEPCYLPNAKKIKFVKQKFLWP